MDLSLIDFVLVAVIAAGIIIGARRGIIEQVASIIAIVTAIIVTRIWGEDATRLLAELIPGLGESGDTISSMVGHITLFILVYAFIRLFGSGFKKMFHSLKMGAADRVSGAIFCVLKYCLIMSVILNVWLLISPKSTVVSDSKLMNGKVSSAVVSFAPWLLTSDFIPWTVDVVKGKE